MTGDVPRVVWAAVLFTSALTAVAAENSRIDFNFKIRPLLSDRCFACHGPDEKARKAKLDLRTRDGVLRGGASGLPAIEPGAPERSELWRRISTSDPDDRMPPPESKLPALTPEEITIFRRWIEQGAEYQQHWAFRPIEAPLPPEPGTPGGDSETAADVIDRFILARLKADGLGFQPEATREELIRRLSLDLTGLPPTLEEVDAFRADASPAAYARCVDRLLASPHYGERMAQEWMDLARFADTFGYQADVDHDLSPWRDWVIRALNANLPWDRFITWQLAGDLLPAPTPDQVLATAFNRLHRQTNEGGSIEEEFRTEYIADRVHTMGTAFLGLTLECARCHDHKYDPISQRDYYRLFAYFNSIDESGLYSHFTRATPTPVMLLREDDARQEHDALLEDIAGIEEELASIRQDARPRFAAGKAAHKDELLDLPVPAVHLPFEAIADKRTADARSTNAVVLHDDPELVPGVTGNALRFSGDNSAVISHAGKFGRTDSFTFSLGLKIAEPQSRAVVFHYSRAWTDSGSRGYELLLDEGRPWFALIHFWPGNAIAVRAKEALPREAWTHLAISYDGSSRASGIRLYRDGRPLEVELIRDHLYKDIQHRAEWGDSEPDGIHLTLAGRFRDNGFKNGSIDEFMAFDTILSPVEIAALHLAAIANATGSPKSSAPDLKGLAMVTGPEALLEHYLARHDAAYRAALGRLHSARTRENVLVTPVREIMVMQELPEPRPAFVLRRGAYDAQGEVAEPGTPERIMAMEPDLPRNRLGLARWITDPRHPLTARVAVNRIWKHHFGRGLVATTWDFGAQGQLPTHPELLDWLARRYIDSGWNRKALHRLIVMSATYRQSSVAPSELVARDPENRLLARGPKHRLEAEQIRDRALAASGLLVPNIGGPSVKPYQPPGVWEDAGTGKKYTPDEGAKLHRRSLYTFWRRTAPPPNMLTFDATTREVCTAKRESTTTPLQSLVLLNDPQFLEAARALAEQVLAAHPHDSRTRAREVFRRLTGRSPDVEEMSILARLEEEQRAYFTEDPDAAEEYVRLGDKERGGSFPVVDLAAVMVVASAVMNHDEFVMKR
jgi:hypothetical protein